MIAGPRSRVDRHRRALDLVLTVPGSALALPLLAGTALAVRIRMGSPVLFRQERAGRDGKPFMLLKFRTMTVRAGDSFDPTHDATRLTPLGARLRRVSLDELPQIWNVLRGDMALVGPRPLPVVYVDRYSIPQRRRLRVRPGITGLAQVSGRNKLSWEDKFSFDLRYVDKRGVALDLTILWRTLAAALCREGISAEGEATMSEFMGTEVGA
jgi:lipopolysaccharide/colanic/teichoic acid biosynthesis glycosyltransferase